MTRVGIYLAIFTVISTLAFNNCAGGKFETLNATNLVSSASAQCRQKIMATVKVSEISDPSACESAANYQCDLRRFRPEVPSGKSTRRHCVSIAGLGDICIPVDVYNYNTRAQQQQSSD